MRRRCVLAMCSRIINGLSFTGLLNHLHEKKFSPIALFKQTLFDETPLKLCVDENGTTHKLLRAGRPATCKVLQVQLRIAVLMNREPDEEEESEPCRLFVYRFVAPLQV